MSARGIALCADDYGLAPGVSRAIRELVERGRLSAVSCLVTWPELDAEARRLAELSAEVDVGLHLDLTRDRSLASLALAAFLRRLDTHGIARELERQLEAFTTAFGRAPTFIDGHEHVHLLPGIRERVADAAARLGASLRVTREPLADIARTRVAPGKALVLSLLARPLAREAARRGIRANRGFRGARGFREPSFREPFRRMIAGAREGTLVMCHPGIVDAELAARDRVTRAREVEYLYFSGPDFPADLAAEGVRLVRPSELAWASGTTQ